MLVLRAGCIAVLVHPASGIDDRTITGAAAEIARERVVDVAARWPVRRLVQREQRHHKAGCAKAALRAMAVDERLLDRMQRAIIASQALDGDQLLAVERRDKLNARIDRAKSHAAVLELADDDGTCAAIALGTAFLRTGATQILAQILKHRPRRIDIVQRDDVTVEREAHGAL